MVAKNEDNISHPNQVKIKTKGKSSQPSQEWEKVFKLDGVGSVDNRPSTNKLHQIVRKKERKKERKKKHCGI